MATFFQVTFTDFFLIFFAPVTFTCFKVSAFVVSSCFFVVGVCVVGACVVGACVVVSTVVGACVVVSSGTYTNISSSEIVCALYPSGFPFDEYILPSSVYAPDE